MFTQAFSSLDAYNKFCQRFLRLVLSACGKSGLESRDEKTFYVVDNLENLQIFLTISLIWWDHFNWIEITQHVQVTHTHKWCQLSVWKWKISLCSTTHMILSTSTVFHYHRDSDTLIFTWEFIRLARNSNLYVIFFRSLTENFINIPPLASSLQSMPITSNRRNKNETRWNFLSLSTVLLFLFSYNHHQLSDNLFKCECIAQTGQESVQ